MKRIVFALVLASWISFCAYGSDILDTIPDDAVIVAVGSNYEGSVGALKLWLDASVPQSLTDSASAARLPVLRRLTELRSVLDKAQVEEGAYASESVGFVLLAGGDGAWYTVTLQAVSEPAWQTANASNIKETPKGRQVVRGDAQFFFQFNGEYLVRSASAEAISMYDRSRTVPLSAARRSAIDTMLRKHTVAVNVSAPTLARVWKAKQMTAADAVAGAVGRFLDDHSTGLGMIPFPERFTSAIIADFLAHGDEIYAAVDFAGDSIDFAGQVLLKKDNFYGDIIAQQEGGAEVAADLVPISAAAALCARMDGENFWRYARSMIGPFVAGVLKEQGAIPGSLKTAQQAFDDFRARVGLKRTAFMSICAQDGKYPVPAVAAEVDDPKVTVGAIAGDLMALYADQMLQSYGKQSGLYFGAPAREQQSPEAAAIRIPFSVSASDPVRAAKVRDVLGKEIVWRVAAGEEGGRSVLVAGQFPKEDSINAVVTNAAGALASTEGSAPDAAAGARGMFGDFLSRPGKTLAVGFLNLPLLTAARMKTAAKVSGGSITGYSAEPSAPGCVVRVFAEEGSLGFDGTVPAGQLHGAFAVFSKSSAIMKPAVIKPTDTEEKEKGSGRKRPRSHFGGDGSE